MLRPKKNSYKEVDNEKKIPAAQKFPTPHPYNFSNGPSLSGHPWGMLRCPLNTVLVLIDNVIRVSNHR